MMRFALRAAEALFMATTVMLLSYQPTTTLFAAAAACADNHNRSCFDCLMAGCDGTTNDDGDFECIKLAQPFAWNPADARQVCQPHDCQLITSSCEECLDNKCSWLDSGSCAANPGENGDECDGALPSFGPHWVVDADKNVTEICARLEKQQQDNHACAGATTCQDCQSTMAAPDVACKWFENSYCRPSGNVDLGCMETDCDGESLAPCIGLGCQACVIAGCTWRNGPGTCRKNCSFWTESCLVDLDYNANDTVAVEKLANICKPYDCAAHDDCLSCLDDECSWTGFADRPCGLWCAMDVPCLSNRDNRYPDRDWESECQAFDANRRDDVLCGQQDTCEQCQTTTLETDPNATCNWYEGYGGLNYCARYCHPFGCSGILDSCSATDDEPTFPPTDSPTSDAISTTSVPTDAPNGSPPSDPTTSSPTSDDEASGTPTVSRGICAFQGRSLLMLLCVVATLLSASL